MERKRKSILFYHCPLLVGIAEINEREKMRKTEQDTRISHSLVEFQAKGDTTTEMINFNFIAHVLETQLLFIIGTSPLVIIKARSILVLFLDLMTVCADELITVLSTCTARLSEKIEL